MQLLEFRQQLLDEYHKLRERCTRNQYLNWVLGWFLIIIEFSVSTLTIVSSSLSIGGTDMNRVTIVTSVLTLFVSIVYNRLNPQSRATLSNRHRSVCTQVIQELMMIELHEYTRQREILMSASALLSDLDAVNFNLSMPHKDSRSSIQNSELILSRNSLEVPSTNLNPTSLVKSTSGKGKELPVDSVVSIDKVNSVNNEPEHQRLNFNTHLKLDPVHRVMSI